MSKQQDANGTRGLRMYANAALSVPLSSYIQDGKRGSLLRSERGSVKKRKKKKEDGEEEEEEEVEEQE